MAVSTVSGSPSVIEQGDTVLFSEKYTSYPSALWYLDFIIQAQGSGNDPNTFRATNDPNTTNGFLVTLNAANTANFVPGRYQFAQYVTEISSGQRTTAKTGVLQVIPDLTQTQSKSSAQTMLDNIEAAIATLTANPFLSVSVNNVSYTRSDLSTLISMRTRLQAEVIRERRTADAFRGIETSGRIGTRFKS